MKLVVVTTTSPANQQLVVGSFSGVITGAAMFPNSSRVAGAVAPPHTQTDKRG